MTLDNESLHSQNLQLAADERAITQRLLLNLRETERRRMYLQYNQPSLFAYCVHVLKFSEGAASRRVNASRLVAELPELSDKIGEGSVNLSNLSTVQSFVKAEQRRTGHKMSRAQKAVLVEKIESVSQDEAKRALAELLPEAPVATGKKITMFLTDEEAAILERVRELRSHSASDDTTLFVTLLKEDLKRRAPENKTQRFAAAAKPRVGRAYIAVETKRRLHERAGSQCEEVTNGRRCTRRHHLQTDHVIELAMGGSNEFENLQLLCRAHNLQKEEERMADLYNFAEQRVNSFRAAQIRRIV